MLSPKLILDKVRTAAELIAAYDQQLNITLWNPGMEKRMGVAEIDALGRPLFSLFPFAARDQRTKFLNISMQIDQPFFFPNMIYLYTQPFTYYSQYIHPLKENGKIVGVINIVRDHKMEETFLPEEFFVYFEKGKDNSFSSLQHDEDRPSF